MSGQFQSLNRPIQIDSQRDVAEINHELRQIVSGLTEYLGCMPLVLTQAVQVESLATYNNTRLVLENMSLVPLLVNRAAIIGLSAVGMGNPLLSSTVASVTNYLERYAKRLTELAMHMAIYSYTPVRSQVLLNLMTDIARDCANGPPPVWTRLELSEEWQMALLLLEQLENRIRATFTRYLIYLESPMLRADRDE